MPRIESLYVVILRAICAAFPALYMVLTFHVPNKVVVLGVRSGVVLFLSAFTMVHHTSL